jgi:hypothetical protein
MKRARLIALILGFVGEFCLAQTEDLKPVEEWSASEHRVASRAGQEALLIHPSHWQHVQSDHFVIHSSEKVIASNTVQEAEFYFAKIREDLQFGDAGVARKSHMFLFENEEDWKQFAKRIQLDPWTGGFFDGLDLFYRRHTGMGIHHSGATLPHEIAHRVLYEKFPLGSIPLALNEGFAEYESRKLAFLYLRKRNYNVRASSKPVPREKFIPADQLLAMTRYPENDENVASFYDLSECCVNLLIKQHGFPKFLELLQAMASGQTFAAALPKVYSREYNHIDQFERVFEQYAILPKDK